MSMKNYGPIVSIILVVLASHQFLFPLLFDDLFDIFQKFLLRRIAQAVWSLRIFRDSNRGRTRLS